MTLRWPTATELRMAVPIAVPVLVLLGFVLRGCDTARVPLFRPPPGVTLPAAAATSTPEDLTAVGLAAVDGTTTLVPVRATGTSHLSGSVNGPQGPVAGATVRVEHLVEDHPPPIDVVTGADGRWDLPGIAGGRYRVRSFLAPSAAQTEPEIFLLAEGEDRSLDLNMETFVGAVLAAAVAPDPPQLGQPLTLAVRVARKTVDPTGIVHSDPIANAAVTLTATPGWAVRGPSAANTDANGDAVFTLECRTVGAAQVQVAVRPSPTDQPQPATLALSPCVSPDTTTTTESAGSGSSGPPTSATGRPAPN